MRLDSLFIGPGIRNENEAIAFARALHAQLSERGMDVVNGWFEECLPGYTYLRDGESFSS